MRLTLHAVIRHVGLLIPPRWASFLLLEAPTCRYIWPPWGLEGLPGRSAIYFEICIRSWEGWHLLFPLLCSGKLKVSRPKIIGRWEPREWSFLPGRISGGWRGAGQLAEGFPIILWPIDEEDPQFYWSEAKRQRQKSTIRLELLVELVSTHSNYDRLEFEGEQASELENGIL